MAFETQDDGLLCRFRIGFQACTRTRNSKLEAAWTRTRNSNPETCSLRFRENPQQLALFLSSGFRCCALLLSAVFSGCELQERSNCSAIVVGNLDVGLVAQILRYSSRFFRRRSIVIASRTWFSLKVAVVLPACPLIDAKNLIAIIAAQRLADATNFHILNCVGDIFAKIRHFKGPNFSFVLWRDANAIDFAFGVCRGQRAKICAGSQLCDQIQRPGFYFSFVLSC